MWLCSLGFSAWTEQADRELTEKSIQAKIELAHELGVNFNALPYPHLFPHSYFREQLQGGMPITTVHTIIKGYKQVYYCPDNREVYDFFSVDVSIRKRFEIRYDSEKHYIRDSLQGHDPFSIEVDMKNCQVGRLAE
jgi:hypothetical protein